MKVSDLEVREPRLWDTGLNAKLRQDWNGLISGGNTTETNLGPAASRSPCHPNDSRGGEDCMTNSIRDEPAGGRGCQNRCLK